MPLRELRPFAQKGRRGVGGGRGPGRLLADARPPLRGPRAAVDRRSGRVRRRDRPRCRAGARRARDGVHAERVDRDERSARAVGVKGTPAFFVNGALHEGAFDAGSLVAALEKPTATSTRAGDAEGRS
jgi:hypothetical protein